MTIRFLQPVDSETPGFPFLPGQVIVVTNPTPDMLAALRPLPDGSRLAEVVADEEPEFAAVVDPERAVSRRRTRRVS